MSDMIEIPRVVIRLLTDEKFLHSEVDRNIRKGMTHTDAYNEVQSRVFYYVPNLLIYKNAVSYWTARNKKTRELLRERKK